MALPRLNSVTQVIPAASVTAIDIPHGMTVTPQGLLVFGQGAAAGEQNGDLDLMIGASDGTRHFGHSHIIPDGSTVAEAGTSLAETGALGSEMEYATDTVTGKYGWTSWDATNVRITPSDAFVRAKLLTCIFFAGFDGFYVDAFTTPATAADITRTGIPFDPNWALIIAGITGSAMGTVGFRSVRNLAFVTASVQGLVYGDHEGGTSNYTYGARRADRCVLFSANSTTYADEMQFLNFTADGGVIDRVAGSAARPMCIIWGKGGLPKVGTFVMRTAAGGITVATPGHRSRGFIVMSRPIATAESTTPVEPAEEQIGVATEGPVALTQRTIWREDFNAEVVGGGSPTDVHGFQTDGKIYERRTRTGASTTSQAAVAAVTAMSAHQIVIDQTVADVATLVSFISWGDAAGVEDARRRNLALKTRARRWAPDDDRALPGIFAGPFLRLTGVAPAPTQPVDFTHARRRLALRRTQRARVALDDRLEYDVLHTVRAQPFKDLAGPPAAPPNPPDLPPASRRIYMRGQRTGRG